MGFRVGIPENFNVLQPVDVLYEFLRDSIRLLERVSGRMYVHFDRGCMGSVESYKSFLSVYVLLLGTWVGSQSPQMKRKP